MMSDAKWPPSPADGCPFPQSSALRGLSFTGRYATYTGADTWYPSWATDGHMYSPWTDGVFERPLEGADWWLKNNPDCSSHAGHPVNGGTGKSGTGQARIIGDDPLNLRLENLGVEYAPVAPYGGRYPCGSLVVNGLWYYGTYCLDEADGHLNWDVLGPFVGFRISRDYGKSWQETPHTPAEPLFGESGKNGAKVKIGAPHFVDFGQNMRHSPDGKAYLVGHGATRPQSNLAWIAGDQAYLIRVEPTLEKINDRAQYEFFCGHGARGEALWSKDFSRIQPLIAWDNRVGHATMTYSAPLRRYLLCVTDGWPTVSVMNTYILEAERITGPWRLVQFMERFGPQAYFVNIPSRFISADGGKAWLCYSANFTNHYLGTNFAPSPPGSRYAMCLQEIQFELA